MDKTYPSQVSHHVKAHQDDTSDWTKLVRPAQLNCACDATAKQCIIESLEPGPISTPFPLEPCFLFANFQIITSETDITLRFHAHRLEALSLFNDLGILTPDQIQEVAWEEVHTTLHTLPKMFQMFAGKQVFGGAAVLANLSKQKAYAHLGRSCPSFTLHKETTEHLLYCTEVGREANLKLQLRGVGDWLHSIGTIPKLMDLIMVFLYSRGSMIYADREFHVCTTYEALIQSQSHIGWHQTMEGMISQELICLEHSVLFLPHCRLSTQVWFRLSLKSYSKQCMEFGSTEISLCTTIFQDWCPQKERDNSYKKLKNR